MLAILCVGLLAVIAAEETYLVSDVEALPNYAAPPVASVDPPLAVDDVENSIATILDRPLFTPGRRPPPPPSPSGPEAAKVAPELRARLAGMTVGPGEREALFARDNGATIAVKERQEIDGWTVTAIATDKVVVSSTFGERVLKPTPDPRPPRERIPPRPQLTTARPAIGGQPTVAAEKPPGGNASQIATQPKTAPTATAAPGTSPISPGNSAKGTEKSPRS